VRGAVPRVARGMAVHPLTPDDMGRVSEGWKLRPSTPRKKLERLRSFFKFCVERKWIETNPTSELRPPKEHAIEKKPYEAEELEKIAWAIPLFPAKGIYARTTSSVSARSFRSCDGRVLG
jgi:hypothetical protein